MKKFFFGSAFVLTLLCSGCFLWAQDYVSWSNMTWDISKTAWKLIDTNLTSQVMAKSFGDINSIKVSICNQSWSFFSLIPGEEKDICFKFENYNDWAIFVLSDFFETSFTVSWYPVCNSWNPDNLFAKAISNVSGISKIKVPAKSYVEKNIKMRFPLGSSWLYHFCHYYKVTSDWSSIPMFNIVVHKQNFFDIFLNSENTILSGYMELVSLTKVKSDDEKSRYVKWVSFSLKNNFPFDQKTEVTLVVSNIFWFKKELIMSGDIIWYNRSKDFYFDISDLPYYKWFFNLDLKIDYKPSFGFDVSGSGIPQKILDWWKISQHMSFFIFDKSQLMALWFLILIIFLIKMAFFSKPRVVYVESKNATQSVK